MRVAIVSPYALSVHGGVQEQAISMSRELVRRGVETLLVAPDENDQTVYDTPASVARFGRLVAIRANGSRAPLTLQASAARRANQAIQAFRPDVVHYHEPLAPRLGYASLRRHASPAVATFHRNGGGPAVSLARYGLGWLSSRVDVAVAVSPAAAVTARHMTGLEPIVSFNGFDIERFDEFPRIKNDLPTFVVVGRLEERKGVSVVVDAVRENNRESEPWRLIIIGDGPQRGPLEERAAGDAHIQFLGAVDDATKRRWWRQADVALAPALRGESFGLVLLEAMASRTPVVASDIDGYREASGGHAIKAKPGDIASWRQSMAQAISPTGVPPIEAAWRHAAQWSMTALMDNYIKYYARAIHAFRGAR